METGDDLDIKISLVKKQACFAKLTSDESEKLAALFIEKHFQAGDVVVTEGEPVDSIYLIVDGTAEIRQAFVKDGKVETKFITTIGPGASVGLNETGFYSLSGRRTATVIASTDIIALKLSIAEFHGFSLTYSHVNEIMRQNSQANERSRLE